MATGQVKLKAGVNVGVEVEIRPDVMLFKLDSDGNIISSNSIWEECKIRPSSPMTTNQNAALELPETLRATPVQLEFKVLTDKLVGNGLPINSKVTIQTVNQVSMEGDKIIVIPKY